MKLSNSIILAPLLCLGVLGGMTAERATRLRPADAEPFHARAAAAVAAVPTRVEIDGRPWAAETRKLPAAAVELLRPNAHAHLHFAEAFTADGGGGRTADLLVVQCKDSGDMTGHYPPICYRGRGYVPVSTDVRPAVEVAPGVRVPYTEYQFEQFTRGRAVRTCIYNFFVVPGRGIVPTIDHVNEAAEDYQRQFFGAAQFQVLVAAELPRGEREAILTALLRANEPLLRTLSDTGTPGDGDRGGGAEQTTR